MTNIDYSKTIIYKIVCKNEDVKDVYVGSTTRFNERRREHKKRCNNENYNEYNHKKYKIIRANGGWDNWTMIEIIKQPCNDGDEARALERHYYELLNCTMNTCKPHQTSKEYKEQKQIYKKEYYQQNKERLNEYQRQFRIKKKIELQKINHEKYS